MVIAPGFHLFPFRTEKLSPVAPMVLHTRGRVGSRLFSGKPHCNTQCGFSHFLKKGGCFLCSWVFQLCFQTLLVLRTARRSVLVKRRLCRHLFIFFFASRRSEDRCRFRSVIYPLSIFHFPLNFVPLHLKINFQLSTKYDLQQHR